MKNISMTHLNHNTLVGFIITSVTGIGGWILNFAKHSNQYDYILIPFLQKIVFIISIIAGVITIVNWLKKYYKK